MDKNIDYYKILNVSRTSNSQEIKLKYRTLSKQLHPDSGGDEKYFKLISEAYKILTKHRKEYDEESKYGANYNSMFELLEFEFTPQESGSNVDSKKDTFKETEMLHIIIKLKKFKTYITYKRNIICSSCEGSGKKSAQDINFNMTQENMEKLGAVKNNNTSIFDSDIECDLCIDGEFNGVKCPVCKGDGYIRFGLNPCTECSSGLKTISKTIKLKKEDFVDGKHKFLYHGNQSKYGDKIGNLYIIIAPVA